MLALNHQSFTDHISFATTLQMLIVTTQEYRQKQMQISVFTYNTAGKHRKRGLTGTG